MDQTAPVLGMPTNPADPRGLIPYIRERAQAYGINPDTAVDVARSEGLSSFKSGIPGENSYTAFQLNTQNGLGNDFQRATGLDPANPNNEHAAIDFALKHASQHGWGAFHGAKNRYGYGPWEGITVGSAGNVAPPISGPAPTNPGTQSPAPAAAPTQQQQLEAAGGNGGGAAAPSAQQGITPIMRQMLAMYRPQVNQAPLQNFMQQLPTTLFPSNLKPFSF
jgi:hypothetical protein